MHVPATQTSEFINAVAEEQANQNQYPIEPGMDLDTRFRKVANKLLTAKEDKDKLKIHAELIWLTNEVNGLVSTSSHTEIFGDDGTSSTEDQGSFDYDNADFGSYDAGDQDYGDSFGSDYADGSNDESTTASDTNDESTTSSDTNTPNPSVESTTGTDSSSSSTLDETTTDSISLRKKRSVTSATIRSSSTTDPTDPKNKKHIEPIKDQYKNKTISSVLDEIGWKVNEMSIFFAKFKNSPINLKKRITKVMTPQGYCGLFNTSLPQTTAGDGNGLKLFVNIQQDYYTLDMINLELSTLEQAGVNVYIYKKNVKYPDLSKPISIPPGRIASLALVEERFEYMERPWGACDPELKDSENHFRRDCLEECYIKKVVARCGCRPSYADKSWAHINQGCAQRQPVVGRR